MDHWTIWTYILVGILMTFSGTIGFVLAAILAAGKHSDDCADCQFARLLWDLSSRGGSLDKKEG